MGKIQLPSVGGIRKVIKTGDQSTPGTTIAELGNQTITLAQLAQLITLLQAQQANNGGGNIGQGDEATLALGPGLAGGGVIVGNVPVRITAPIPWGLDDGGGGGDGDPGPPGQAGVPGALGATGGTGPQGVAIFMAAEDGEDGWHAIPGNAGPQGVQGSQGPQGIQGSGNSAAGLMMWVPDDTVTDEAIYTGPASARGALTVNGPFAVNGTATHSGNLVFDAITSRNMTFLGSTPIIQATQAAGVLSILSGASGSIGLGLGATLFLQLNSTGTCTLSGASGTGQQLLIQATGAVAAIITQAGNSSADTNMIWKNNAATPIQLMKLFGDGGLTIGTNTLTDMTTGSVNVSRGYFVNNILVGGGANLTPAGTMHGMIPEDPQWEDEIYRSPTGAQGATVFNGKVLVNAGPNSAVTPAMQINVSNASTDAFLLNGISGTVGPDFAFLLDGTATKGILGVASKANEGVTGITTGEMYIRTQTTRLLLTVDGGSTAALIVSTGGPATFSSSLSIKGPTPAAVAGTTTFGTTTTTSGVITTAGGVSLPALALFFMVTNVNGTQVGIPCFAL